MTKRILVACEFSGVVREAFAARGWDAWSCDLEPTEIPGQHIQADVMTVLNDGWDMMIAHPPCTYLSRAGARWKSPERDIAAQDAMAFFMALWYAPIKRIALENPIGKTWKLFRHPDQVVHPYHFGDPFTKATCLWLKVLPPLLYTRIVTDPFVNWTEFGHRSAKNRSRTFPGIADAMAVQWGCYHD